LVVAEHCADASAFDQFMERVKQIHIQDKHDKDHWEVSAQAGDQNLETSRDGDRILYRRINGQDVSIQGITINGESLKL